MNKDFESFVKLYTNGKEDKIKIPTDILLALKKSPKANKLWNTLSLKNQLNWILWIISGKMKETRIIRINKMLDMLSGGKKRVCCFGGINWLIKTNK
jgi:uncharacterized protein YdeI (YjbR/CyaY-like superfamily)